jgi:hypothetical protein
MRKSIRIALLTFSLLYHQIGVATKTKVHWKYGKTEKTI